MKAIFLGLAVLSSPLAQAGSVPSDATFNKTADQAHRLGYFGYDVMVCLSKSGQVVAGGLWSWNAPLQIYLVSNGAVTSTKRTSPPEEEQTHKFVTGEGNEVALSLGEVTGTSHGEGPSSVVKYENAVLAEGPMEMAQLVSCYSRQSGLESVH